jgi:hypothetical protein
MAVPTLACMPRPKYVILAFIALASWNQNSPTERLPWGMAMADISSTFMYAELPMEGEVDIRSPGEMPSDSRQGA